MKLSTLLSFFFLIPTVSSDPPHITTHSDVAETVTELKYITNITTTHSVTEPGVRSFTEITANVPRIFLTTAMESLTRTSTLLPNTSNMSSLRRVAGDGSGLGFYLASRQYGPHLPHEAIFQVVHTILTVLALASICLFLMVVYGIVPKLTPPLRVLTSLSFANMLAPWAIMTLYFSRSTCQDEIHTSVLLASHNVVALTLASLALFLNVATFRPLQYDRIASSRRVWTSVGLIWIISILLAHVHFVVSALKGRGDQSNGSELRTGRGAEGTRPRLQSFGYCDVVQGNTGIALVLSGCLGIMVTMFGAIVYTRILIHLRPVEAFLPNPSTSAPSSSSNDGTITWVRGEGDRGNNLPRRSTRGVFTGVGLLVGYTFAWLPYVIVKYVSVMSMLTVTATNQTSLSTDGRVQVQGGGPGREARIVTTQNSSISQLFVGICQVLIILSCILTPLICACRINALQVGYITFWHRWRQALARSLTNCRRRSRHCYRGRGGEAGGSEDVPSTLLNQISESTCY